MLSVTFDVNSDIVFPKILNLHSYNLQSLSFFETVQKQRIAKNEEVFEKMIIEFCKSIMPPGTEENQEV